MSNIKCNTLHCKNNNNEECQLENINICFTDDCERYGAYCGNFQEKIEYIRNKYELLKLNDDYLVIGKTIDSSFDFIKEIIEEIKELENNSKVPTIYIDDLIRFGTQNETRFFSYKDTNLEVLSKKDNVELIEEIQKHTCNYFRENPEILNNSLVNSFAIKMILKGFNL